MLSDSVVAGTSESEVTFAGGVLEGRLPKLLAAEVAEGLVNMGTEETGRYKDVAVIVDVALSVASPRKSVVAIVDGAEGSCVMNEAPMEVVLADSKDALV